MPQSEIQKHIEELKDSDQEVCKRAAEALGEIGDPAAVPALTEAIQTKNNEVGTAAVKALRNLGLEGFTVYAKALGGTIDQLQNTKNEFVRRSAAEGLGEIGDPAAVPFLIKALKDKDMVVRSLALYSLGKIGDPAAVPALIKALKVKANEPDVRRFAVETLGEIGDPAAVPALIKAVKDKDEEVRKAAAHALKKLQGND